MQRILAVMALGAIVLVGCGDRFVCFLTDPDSGQIHLQLGMDQPVTIR